MKNWKRNTLGLLISLACIGFIAWKIDLNEIAAAIDHFNWKWLFIGIGSLAFGYGIRIIRWASILRSVDVHISTSECIAPFLGSIALNNVFPMRIGDVVRALIFPKALGIGRVAASSSLVMERMVDLVTLIACLTVGLLLTPKLQVPVWVVELAASLGIVAFMSLAFIIFFSGMTAHWIGRLERKSSHLRLKHFLCLLNQMLKDFNAASRMPLMLKFIALSLIVWVAEAGLFWSLMTGFGLEMNAGYALVVMAVATLATLVPSSPGYVGPFHLAAFAILSVLGSTPAQAASFAVLSHLCLWLPTTLAGALAILYRPGLFSFGEIEGKSSKSINSGY